MIYITIRVYGFYCWGLFVAFVCQCSAWEVENVEIGGWSFKLYVYDCEFFVLDSFKYDYINK